MSSKPEGTYDSLRLTIPGIVRQVDCASKYFGHHNYLELRVNELLDVPSGQVLKLYIGFDQGVVIGRSQESTISRTSYSKKDHDLWVNVALGRQIFDLQPLEFKDQFANLFKRTFVLMNAKMQKLGLSALAESFGQATEAALADYEASGYMMSDVQINEMYVTSIKPLLESSKKVCEDTEYYLYFPDPSLAEAAASRLPNNVKHILEASDDDVEAIKLLVWQTGVMTVDGQLEDLLTDLASEFGGEYDGYETGGHDC